MYFAAYLYLLAFKDNILTLEALFFELEPRLLPNDIFLKFVIVHILNIDNLTKSKNITTIIFIYNSLML